MVANWVTNYCDVCIIYFAGEFKSWGISQGDSKIELCVMCIVESSSNSAPCCLSWSPRSLLFVQPHVGQVQVRDTEARPGQGQQHRHQPSSTLGRSAYKRVSTYIIDCSLSKLSILILLVCVDLLPYLHCAMCWLAPARRCDWW